MRMSNSTTFGSSELAQARIRGPLAASLSVKARQVSVRYETPDLDAHQRCVRIPVRYMPVE
jgi:hypothetical protein